MGLIADLIGTTRAVFGFGPKATRGTLDWSALTQARTVSLPDRSGEAAVLDGGALVLDELASSPSAPADGRGLLFAGDTAGLTMPEVRTSGRQLAAPLGAWRGLSNVRELRYGASGFATQLGCAHQYAGGRGSSLSADSLLQQIQGIEVASTTTAGTGGHVYQSSNPATRKVGFAVVIPFGVIADQPGQRVYVGLQDTSFSNDVNVDWLSSASSFNRLGLALNTNSGNWQLHQRIGASIVNTDLGSGFAFSASDHIELVLACPPNGASIGYRVRRRTSITGGIQAEASGSLSSTIFGNDTQLYMGARISNGSTAAIAALRVAHLYMESEH
jgi:hypothetical protein